VAHATAVGPKVVFDAPLELRAKSALVAWSVAAMVVHLVLTSAFGPRDPEDGGKGAPPEAYWTPAAPPPTPPASPAPPASPPDEPPAKE
jgi:hypothetical protein